MGIAFANFLTAPSFDVFGSMEKWRLTFLVPSLCSLFQLAVPLHLCPESPSILIKEGASPTTSHPLPMRMQVLPFCPESPSFLIKKGGSELALSTLKKVRALARDDFPTGSLLPPWRGRALASRLASPRRASPRPVPSRRLPCVAPASPP